MNCNSYYSSRWCLSLILSVLLLSSGCESLEEDMPRNEGVIVYDVTFPSQRESILINVYPSEMHMAFKENMLHGYLESIGGLVRSDIIVDTKRKRYWQLLSSFGDKIYCEMEEDMVKKHFVATQRSFERTGSDEFLGFECLNFSSVDDPPSFPAVEVKTTNEIELRNPNWYTPYSELNDVMLQYQLEQYGMNMHLAAREVRFEEVDAMRFEVPSNYTVVSVDSMMLKLQDLMAEIPK